MFKKILLIGFFWGGTANADTFKSLEELYIKHNLTYAKKQKIYDSSAERVKNNQWYILPKVSFSKVENNNTSSENLIFDLSIVDSTKLLKQDQEKINLELEEIYLKIQESQVKIDFCYAMYFYERYDYKIKLLNNMLSKLYKIKDDYLTVIDNTSEKMQFLKFLYDIQKLLSTTKKEYINFEKKLREADGVDLSAFQNKAVGIKFYPLSYDKQNLVKQNPYFKINDLQTRTKIVDEQLVYGRKTNLGVKYTEGEENSYKKHELGFYFTIDLYNGSDRLIFSNKEEEHIAVGNYDSRISQQKIFTEIDSKIANIKSNIKMYSNVNDMYNKSYQLYKSKSKIFESTLQEVQDEYSFFIDLKRQYDYEKEMIQDLLFVYQYLMKTNACYLMDKTSKVKGI